MDTIGSYVSGLLTNKLEVTRPLADQADRRFMRDVIAWSRNRAAVHTELLPEDLVESVDGVQIIEGFRVTSDRWATWAYASFVTLCVTTFAVLAAERGPPFLRDVVGLVGLSITLVSGAVAYWLWRRSKRPLQIFVIGSDEKVTGRRMSRISLRSRHGVSGGDTWVIAAGGFSPGAARRAAFGEIRCLVRGETGFVDVPVTQRPVPPVKPVRGAA